MAGFSSSLPLSFCGPWFTNSVDLTVQPYFRKLEMASIPNSFGFTRETLPQKPPVQTWRGLMFRPALPWVMALVLSTGCSEKNTAPVSGSAPLTSGPAAEPATNVLGVKPAAPTQDSSSSTSPAKSDMNQAQQSTAMPMPGQANDHSVLEPRPSQKPASR